MKHKTNEMILQLLTWYTNCDCINIFAKLINANVLKKLINIPPNTKKLPRRANNAEQLSATNTTLVPKNAVTTICGFNAMTRSKSGPIELPVKNPKPNNIDKRV